MMSFVHGDLLHETISLGTSRIGLIALKDDLLKLTVGLKDLLKIGLGDAKVNVTDIEAMEGGTVGSRSGAAFRRTSSAVLLSLGKLGNDRHTLEFLASQLEGLGNGSFVLELNISNTAMSVNPLGTSRGSAVLTPWSGQ
jgi:hypothetical protein